MKGRHFAEGEPRGPSSPVIKYSRRNPEDRHFSESKKTSTFVTRKTCVRFFQRIPFIWVEGQYVAHSLDIDFPFLSRKPSGRRDSMRGE